MSLFVVRAILGRGLFGRSDIFNYKLIFDYQNVFGRHLADEQLVAWLSNRMTSMKKAKLSILRLAIISIVTLTLVFMGVSRYNQMKFETRIQESKDPQEIVDAFLQALMTNNFQFAEKLVVSGQKQHIEQWKKDTNHKPQACLENSSLRDIFEPYAGGVGGSGMINDYTAFVDSSYSCLNNDYSIWIEAAIVKYDGVNWRITHWDKICESSAEGDSPDICFPGN